MSDLPNSSDIPNFPDGLGTNDAARRQLWDSTKAAIEADGLTLHGEISHGASCVVFSAREKQTGRKLAVKVIVDPNNPKSLELFQKEFRVLASEDVPSDIVPNLILGRLTPTPTAWAQFADGGGGGGGAHADGVAVKQRIQPYLVMEHIRGKKIHEYAAENELTLDRRIDLVEKVFRALEPLLESRRIIGHKLDRRMATLGRLPDQPQDQTTHPPLNEDDEPLIPWLIENPFIAEEHKKLTQRYAAINEQLESGKTDEAHTALKALDHDIDILRRQNAHALSVQATEQRFDNLKRSVSPRIQELLKTDPELKSVHDFALGGHADWKTGSWGAASRQLGQAIQRLNEWLDQPDHETLAEKDARQPQLQADREAGLREEVKRLTEARDTARNERDRLQSSLATFSDKLKQKDAEITKEKTRADDVAKDKSKLIEQLATATTDKQTLTLQLKTEQEAAKKQMAETERWKSLAENAEKRIAAMPGKAEAIAKPTATEVSKPDDKAPRIEPFRSLVVKTDINANMIEEGNIPKTQLQANKTKVGDLDYSWITPINYRSGFAMDLPADASQVGIEFELTSGFGKFEFRDTRYSYAGRVGFGDDNFDLNQSKWQIDQPNLVSFVLKKNAVEIWINGMWAKRFQDQNGEPKKYGMSNVKRDHGFIRHRLYISDGNAAAPSK